MPHNPIRVVVGPANYFSHPGSFNHLHDFFTDEQLSRAVWIDPAKTWQQYEASGGKLKLNVPANVSTEQMKVLSDNEKLMDDLGANVTPAIYYMSKENTLQQAVGLPDQKTLNIIMGNK